MFTLLLNDIHSWNLERKESNYLIINKSIKRIIQVKKVDLNGQNIQTKRGCFGTTMQLPSTQLHSDVLENPLNIYCHASLTFSISNPYKCMLFFILDIKCASSLPWDWKPSMSDCLKKFSSSSVMRNTGNMQFSVWSFPERVSLEPCKRFSMQSHKRERGTSRSLA